jgi:hypothetical protein
VVWFAFSALAFEVGWRFWLLIAFVACLVGFLLFVVGPKGKKRIASMPLYLVMHADEFPSPLPPEGSQIELPPSKRFGKRKWVFAA